MPDHAGFAAAITVREPVLRAALQAGYANGSDTGKRFVEDLSGGDIGMVPSLFLGPFDLECEGTTNLLVATLPMWGRVTVTRNEASHVVDIVGEMERSLTPAFRRGIAANNTESSMIIDQVSTVIEARRWTASVTSPGTPADIAALITGNEFRNRFGDKFRQGVQFARSPCRRSMPASSVRSPRR